MDFREKEIRTILGRVANGKGGWALQIDIAVPKILDLITPQWVSVEALKYAGYYVIQWPSGSTGFDYVGKRPGHNYWAIQTEPSMGKRQFIAIKNDLKLRLLGPLPNPPKEGK